MNWIQRKWYFSLQNNQYSIHVNLSKKWVSILLWVSWATIEREHQRRKSKDRTFVCFVVLLQSDCWLSYVYAPHLFLSFWNFLSFYKISFAVERYESIHFSTRDRLFFYPYCTSKVSLSLVSKFNPPKLPNCFFSLLAILGLIVSQYYELSVMRHVLVSFILYSLSFKFYHIILKLYCVWISTANSLLVNYKWNVIIFSHQIITHNL